MKAVDEQLCSTAEELDPDLLEGAELLPNRLSLIERMPKNAVVAEVGVSTGDYSAKLLQFSQPAKLYLIDLWSYSPSAKYGEQALMTVKSKFASEIQSGVVEIRRGPSWEQLDALTEDSVDWVYIDAGHDYESCRRDLESAHRVVRPGGFICGHDYTNWLNINRMGVVDAVNKFCNQHRYRMRYLTNQYNRHLSYGLTLSE